MEIIDRPLYLNHVTDLLNRGMMLILTGQRRVGKSYVLKSLVKWLRTNREAPNIVYIDKELYEFRDIKTADDLYGYAKPKFPLGGENYLLVDEIQDIKEYERALRSFYAEDLCQVVATGSNAYIFASELHTYLSGRYIQIPVRSLTYKEFLTFHSMSDSDKALMKYLTVGGLPGLRGYDIEKLTKCGIISMAYTLPP